MFTMDYKCVNKVYFKETVIILVHILLIFCHWTLHISQVPPYVRCDAVIKDV